eukprot:TRINITY_DN5669_c0_g2_i6.p1 TRINITY_DN5669_c0_g2~~TRINITY_DN5669_c0_g2_i6.p1  ORF type:complete len:191 (-),score=24.19 TRINITY_DN5669_c0_g2_i6:151-723(-)
MLGTFLDTYKFVNKKFNPQFKPTIGADFFVQDVVIDGKVITLQLWDTAGTERFSSLGRSFYRGADCCVLVFDVCTMKSLEDLCFWKSEFALYADVPENFPYVVLANRVDLTNREVSIDIAKKWCSQNGNLNIFETSAKTGQNIEVAFTSAVQATINLQGPLKLVPMQIGEDLHVTSKNTKKPSDLNDCCS